MFCGYCYKEIPKGQNYYRHRASNNCFCSLDCLTDRLIFSGGITIETSKGEADDEDTEE